MKKYKVEIQACHKVIVEAESKEEARMKVILNLSDYFMNPEMIGNCYVSNPREVENE